MYFELNVSEMSTYLNYVVLFTTWVYDLFFSIQNSSQKTSLTICYVCIQRKK